ncbi:hypothetical protein [Hyalangium rubrum]|uniref:Zinc ribbon domain-containing protein n=1 Tax=Hyalangium rubrum TaxID=3103134 RepID=A0ABU5HB87_9BACT|nr:hypothetical protein [Hyalangium sp. s54d21]MDY7230736.1 hypothetical protein [Hyalangium sp. s54d21]
MPPKVPRSVVAPPLPKCPDCGEVAAEPRLRYCENCGGRMPEYKPPTGMIAAVGEGGEGTEDPFSDEPKKPPYHGPKWLAHVPGHSPTVLGIALQLVALGLSIIPALAGVGPFWSFAMLLGSILVVARELRAAGETAMAWIPESLHPPLVPALYTALSVGLCLPMLEFSVQPLLWIGGTVLLARDQWRKVFLGPQGYAQRFDPRSLLRVPRVLALAGVAVCMLALLFPWINIDFGRAGAAASSIAGRVDTSPRPFGDVVYSGLEDVHTTGASRPVASTIQLALLAVLVITMLRPEEDRPEWLRFVPAGLTVIALAWVLMNMRLKVGPIMFLAGLIPVGLMAVMTALGRDEPAPAYAEDYPPEDDYPTEDDYGPPTNPNDEDMPG